MSRRVSGVSADDDDDGNDDVAGQLFYHFIDIGITDNERERELCACAVARECKINRRRLYALKSVCAAAAAVDEIVTSGPHTCDAHARASHFVFVHI